MYLIVVRQSKLDKDGQFQPEWWKFWRFLYQYSKWCFLGIYLFLSVISGDVILNVTVFLSFQEMLSALGPNTDFERMVEHCLERISRQCTQFLLKTENKMKWNPCFQIWFISQSTFQRWYTSVTVEEANTTFLTLQLNEHKGRRKWNENRENMRINFPGLWDLILLQVTKRHNVKQKCAVKSWFAIHLLYSGKYYKGDVTYCTEWKVTFGKQDIWYLYESTFPKIIRLGIWFDLYNSKFQFGVFISEIN